MTQPGPFKWFRTSPEIIRLAVMLYVRLALTLRNVEDLPDERGVDIGHETVRSWWRRFGPLVVRKDTDARHDQAEVCGRRLGRAFRREGLRQHS